VQARASLHGPWLLHAVQHPDPTQTQSAVELTIQLGQLEVVQEAAALVLQEAISQPFFAELRTKQQLGYVVQAGLRAAFGVLELGMLVQGTAKPPPNVTASILAFVDAMPALVANLSQADLDAHVDSVRVSLLERPRSLGEKAQRDWDHISQRCYDFNRSVSVAHAASSLSLAQLTQLASEIAASPTSSGADGGGYGRLLVQVYGGAQQPLPKAGATAPTHFTTLDEARFRSGAKFLTCDMRPRAHAVAR
jgi:secreted Zn-dependent insulinase-like peptidase